MGAGGKAGVAGKIFLPPVPPDYTGRSTLLYFQKSQLLAYPLDTQRAIGKARSGKTGLPRVPEA